MEESKSTPIQSSFREDGTVFLLLANSSYRAYALHVVIDIHMYMYMQV